MRLPASDTKSLQIKPPDHDCSETSVVFLEIETVERLRDLVCLATGIDIVENGASKLLWEI